MRVPYFADFRTVQGLSNSEAMKFHGPFCGDELQYLKREFFQTRFKVQSCVVNFGERFIRLAAEVFDTPDEQPTQYSGFATKVFQTQGDFMDRRNFLSGFLAASALSLATAGELAAQAGSTADQSAPEYMDLRRYHLASGPGVKLTTAF